MRTALGRRMLFLLVVLTALVVAAASDAREVRVGVFVTSLSGIDARDGSYRIEGYAWFIDPEGVFEPDRDMQILARASSSEVFRRTMLEDGASYTAIRFGAMMDQAFQIRDYPFDSQSLLFAIEAADVDAEITFVPDEGDSRIADFVHAPGWRVAGLSLASGEITYDTGFGYRTPGATFSRLTLTVDLERNRSLLLFEKFTGFFVGLIITAAVFAVPPTDLGIRVGMMTSSIFAAVFNRYRLEDAIGFDAVFGLVDQVSFLTFSAILSVLGISLLSHHLGPEGRRETVASLDRRLGGGVMLIHGALIALAFAVAMR